MGHLVTDSIMIMPDTPPPLLAPSTTYLVNMTNGGAGNIHRRPGAGAPPPWLWGAWVTQAGSPGVASGWPDYSRGVLGYSGIPSRSRG